VPVVAAPLKTAIIAEVVLGATLSLVVIWASGPARTRFTSVAAPLAATLLLTAAGGELAAHAPAFNPAVAAAWAWRPLAAAGLARHAATFWAAPLAGAALAALIWRALDEPVKKRPGAGAARAARAAKKRA
jgi:glycerol uptake facilitator-like aquaporin